MTLTSANPNTSLPFAPASSTSNSNSTSNSAKARAACTGSQPASGAPSAAALAARNRRVEAYRALVRPLARHYANCSAEAAEDLTQVGLLGLIRAAELYRPETGVPFEAFARPHIRGAILHYLRDTAPAVRLPRRQAELQSRLARLQRQQAGSGACKAEEALRQRLGVDRGRLQDLLRWQALSRPLALSPADLESIAAPPEGHELVGSGAARAVAPLLAGLEPRQRRVVEQVVLAGWSYRRLGRELRVSPMTVQRLLRRGLEQLRLELEPQRLNPGRRLHHAASAVPAC
jgi:RNA polymerase sigma-B factor